MTGTKELTFEELKKKYLKDKKVFLKPIEGVDLTLIKKDKTSAHKFMYEGSIYERVLPMDERMNYFDPFESDEEREFFEKITKRNLGLDYRQPDCAWNTSKDGIKLRFQVDNIVKTRGFEFDLSKPYDVLMYKIALTQRDTAPSASVRHTRSHYVWYISDGEEEVSEKKKTFDLNSKLYRGFGAMEGSVEKMRNFLEIYYISNKIPKEVGKNITEDTLKNEIQNLIDNFPNKVANVLDDVDADIKSIMLKGLKCGAITKHSINSYSIENGTKYSLEDFIAFLKKLEKIKDTDDTWGTLLARIELYEDNN